MRIGEIAREKKVSAEVLRKWERAGLIPEPKRTPLGQRDYGPYDVAAIEKVIQQKSKGKKNAVESPSL